MAAIDAGNIPPTMTESVITDVMKYGETLMFKAIVLFSPMLTLRVYIVIKCTSAKG